MQKMRKKLLCFIAAGAIAVSQFIGTVPAAAAVPQSTRVYGANRYDTANAAATKFWSTSSCAVLARGDMYPDALCAGPLAYAYGAPILLTDPNTLFTSTQAVLTKLNVKTIFIIGGTGAVSANIENNLKSKNYTVIRISGKSRYDTSAAVAQRVKEKLGSTPNVVLATGSNYPDALSISSIAAKKGMPILLTEVNSLNAAANNFIKSNSVSKTYVVGGTGVISNKVLGLVPNSKRLGGTDRYSTNVAVMTEFASSLNFNKIFIAVGSDFADALAGSAAAAISSSPVVLVYKALTYETENFLKPKFSGLTNLIILGGAAVVPDSIGTKLISYINIPTLSGVSLTDKATGHKVTAVIEEPAVNTNSGRITFNIPSSYGKFDGGTAVLSEDLNSASINAPKFSRILTNIKKTDNFTSIIFNQMSAVGYNSSDGIASSNIKYLLNGAVLKLTDLEGNIKTYTIIVNY